MNPTSNPVSNTIPEWIRFRTVAYLRDRGLTFGMGMDLFPRVANAPGKFSLNMDLLPNPNISVCDGRTDLFRDDSFDHVVVGPALGQCPDPGKQFRELVSKLKLRGHVVVILPLQNHLPGLRHNFEQKSIYSLLETTGAWKVKSDILRDGWMVVVAKKIVGRKGTIEHYIRPSKPQACIVRYGALGDMVMITPLIRQLAEDGYEVTMNITPYAAPVIENNPFVHNLILQEREAIPNRDLGKYWDEWKGDYDKYINLSESIEGRLLKVENRPDFYTTQEWRNKTCGSVNYYDWTMKLGGYPERTGCRGELFFTPQEIRDAKLARKDFGSTFVIAWSINGSSHHKIYPLLQPVAYRFLESHPNALIVLIGGEEAKQYEFDHPQVMKASGVWPLRKTLAFLAMVADVVVGPESMALNVAACYDVPKVTFLSHSTHENLCKYWTNDFCLAPNIAIAPCYPCHQLHYSMESCPIGIIEDRNTHQQIATGPLCAMGAIEGQRVVETLSTIYTRFAVQTPEAVVR